MTQRHELRVSDPERQAAADRLRAAHDEGRLDLREYDERLVRAYASVTYADLDELFADLPEVPRVTRPVGNPPAIRAAACSVARRQPFARASLLLRILWINWVLAVAVNVTVWTLVNGGGDTYFWPMWLAVPGVVLLGASGTVAAARAHRTALQG